MNLIRIILFTLYFSIAFCGTTGKLAGKVTDLNSGQNIVGCNIIIVDMNMGTASDINGDYVILNIPPGEYSVKAMMIGYSDVVIQNVKFYIDQTTRLDITLDIEAIKGKAIIVKSEKIINKNLIFGILSR